MSLSPEIFTDRKNTILARIAAAAERVGREPGDVQLLAVSKAQPVEKLRAALAAGHVEFGENYAQELVTKHDKLGDSGARFHFIGALQRNKVRHVLGRAAMIHSVDRARLLEELLRRWTPEAGPLPFLVEVNVGGEESKSGCTVDQALPLVQRALEHPAGLVPAGLMTVPPFSLSPEEVRPYFQRLAALRDEIHDQLPPDDAAAFRHLSMGMSGDFEVAVEEGATIVRVGTALFGSRT